MINVPKAEIVLAVIFNNEDFFLNFGIPFHVIGIILGSAILITMIFFYSKKETEEAYIKGVKIETRNFKSLIIIICTALTLGWMFVHHTGNIKANDFKKSLLNTSILQSKLVHLEDINEFLYLQDYSTSESYKRQQSNLF